MSRSGIGVVTFMLLGCSRDLTIPSEVRPPEIGLVAPCRDGIATPCRDNAVVSGEVIVTIARTGGGELSAVELWTPGIEVQTLTVAPWSWTIDTKRLAPVGGVLPVYVTPVGTTGIRASPVQFSFIADNAGPALTVVAPVHDTSWPMTLPIAVTVCASDVQGVAAVAVSTSAGQSTLTASGICADGQSQFTGSLPAPSGPENTLPFDLSVKASDGKANTSSATVSLVATRQRWSRVIRAPAQFYGGALAPVQQSVQHAFRAYLGGVVVQTNTGHIFWLPFDGSEPAVMQPSLTRYGFAPFQNGSVAMLTNSSPSALTAYRPDLTRPFTTTGTDWGGVGSLVGFGDDLACFGGDDNNFNPLFKRLVCVTPQGAIRFSYGLDQLTDDIAALAVAGSYALVLRAPTSFCGLQFDRYDATGQLLAASPCLYTRPVHPYVHADAYGAVVTAGSFLSAQMDPSTGAVSAVATTHGALVARGSTGHLLWVLNDSTLLGTTVSVSDVTGTFVLWTAALPFRASAPIGFQPIAGGFDAFYTDAAAFDDTGNVYAALLESTLNGPVFHVVSFDPSGALRWQYTTGALVALSLSPVRTDEPLYVLHDDGTIDALVR